MSQMLIIMSSLMSIGMLVVIGLLARTKARCKRRQTLSLLLAGGSFGAFFGIAMEEIQQYGHAFTSGFVPFGGLLFGFLLAIATGGVFVWQRVHVS